ncbi:MAG: BrnA antitoxin family protein [Rhodospirillales bacterium]|nr:BrnA antitoxin family protein [Rhodospirillales bacterium]
MGNITGKSVRGLVTEADWRRADSLTEADIKRAVADDPDAAPLLDDAWFRSAEVVMPERKRVISIRLDKDVLDYFRSRGPQYQTRINAVLKAYVQAKTNAR